MSSPLSFPMSLEEWKDSILEQLPALLVDKSGTIVRNTRLAETVLRVLAGGLVTKKVDVFLPGSGIIERVAEQGNISTAPPGVATAETFGREGKGIRGDGSEVKLWIFTYAFCAKTTGELHVTVTLFQLDSKKPGPVVANPDHGKAPAEPEPAKTSELATATDKVVSKIAESTGIVVAKIEEKKGKK